MEAESPVRCLIVRVAAIVAVLGLAATSEAANFRTQNFLVQAPTPELATAVGQAAEKYRHDLAVYWTGQPLRHWPTPCPVRVIAGPHLAAQGVTTYNPAPVRDFQMEVVGTPERILDSVLPHEVTHTVLATYFGRPLPRWADEGICTTVEHDSERNKHEVKLREFLQSRRGIPMNQLFLMTEYPNDVLPLYAQGYSVCQFLIAQKGPQAFIEFLRDYVRHPSWTANVQKHYEYESLAELQDYWVQWVSAGSGPVAQFAKIEMPGNSIAQASIAQASATEIVATPQAESEPMALAAGVAANAVAPARPEASAYGSAEQTDTLNQAGAGGWYQRQKQQSTELANSGDSPRVNPAAIRPIVPPSIQQSGRYQSSQPQPEGGVRRAGEVLSPNPLERISGGMGASQNRY
jgi:hypothetical protein